MDKKEANICLLASMCAALTVYCLSYAIYHNETELSLKEFSSNNTSTYIAVDIFNKSIMRKPLRLHDEELFNKSMMNELNANYSTNSTYDSLANYSTTAVSESESDENYLEKLFPTTILQTIFQDTIAFLNTVDTEYFFERSLSLFPGNEGPILSSLYNKMSVNKLCLNIAIMGGSVGGGHNNGWSDHGRKRQHDPSKTYPIFLEKWLNSHPSFKQEKCQHKVTTYTYGADTVESMVGVIFSETFLHIDSIKFDIIIVEMAVNNPIINKPNEFYEKSKWFELYLRHFLQIPYHPSIVNLELNPNKNAYFSSINTIPAHFAMCSVLKYYQIPSISFWDSMIILMKTHDNKFKDDINHISIDDRNKYKSIIFDNDWLYYNDQMVDGRHPIYSGHNIISAILANYLFIENAKIKNFIKTNSKIQNINEWISNHYIYPNGLLPYPPLFL
eukprot:270936_1